MTLHDGITSIGESAFSETGLKGELKLPKDLTVISQNAFNQCSFSGELVLPKSLRSIGNTAFRYNWRLIGVVDFPEGMQSIGEYAFGDCKMIEGLVFRNRLKQSVTKLLKVVME